MANYFNIEYESTADSSPGSVELNYGDSTTNGLTVHASLYAGQGFIPTHYKMWGVELVQGEGMVTFSGATWIPYVGSRTVKLARHNDPQNAYVKFKDDSETETDTFESNDVTFTFVEPIIHASSRWKTDFEELGFDSASANTLENTTFKTEIEFSKSKVDQLAFNGRDFSGLKIEPMTISVDADSELGQIIELSESNSVTVTKVFDDPYKPLITVDSGSGFETLTAYDYFIKSTISGINATRISNLDWNSNTNTLVLDITRFSTYGFCTVDKVEFTNDSQTAGYIGTSCTIGVYVQDSNGEPVENAPVTVSGIGDNIGSFVESMPVLTSVSGLVTFTLNITTSGSAVYEAVVDGTYFSDPDLTIFGLGAISAKRSLLTQYEQIYRTYDYSDTVSGVNTSAVAEPVTPTVSGSSDSVLEHDLNVLRTLMKQVKGTTNWFDAAPTYFKPDDTNISNDELGSVSLKQIAGNTLDSKTVILAVNDSNSGSGFTINPGDEGFLFPISLPYAVATDRVGLPIFNSTTNSGSYYDEGVAENGIVGIDLINMETASEFRDISGNVIFAKFHDGVDFSGSGDGTDAYVKFYTNAGPYTTTSGDPNSIMVVYPYRKVMSSLAEHEWVRTGFVTSWEGDVVIVDQVADLWSYTGASNNEDSPDWTIIPGSPLVTNESSLLDAINSINDGFSSRIYTEKNYITDGQSITDSLNAIDINLYTISQSVEDSVGEKYIVTVASGISAGTPYQLPVGVSYTPDSTPGRQGGNMDVCLDGQLLVASTGAAGVDANNDYSETSTTHITFHMDVYQYSNLTFTVRK